VRWVEHRDEIAQIAKDHEPMKRGPRRHEAVLSDPVVLDRSAKLPDAVLSNPVVLDATA